MEATLEILKALADASRLAIVSMLAEEDCYVELIANRLRLTSATVSHHLKKLEEAGVVSCKRTQFYQIYSLNREVCSLSIGDFLDHTPDHRDADEKYRDQILAAFTKNGRITTIPTQRKKREVLLRHILRDVPPGTTMTEKEMNELLLAWHEDYCFLRREMIDLGLVSRAYEIYTILPSCSH